MGWIWYKTNKMFSDKLKKDLIPDDQQKRKEFLKTHGLSDADLIQHMGLSEENGDKKLFDKLMAKYQDSKKADTPQAKKAGLPGRGNMPGMPGMPGMGPGGMPDLGSLLGGDGGMGG